MMCPAARAWLVQCMAVQSATGVSFHSGDHPFRFAVSGDHDVDVSCANVGGKKDPAAEGTNFLQATEDNSSAGRIE